MATQDSGTPNWYVTGQSPNQTEVMVDGRVIEGTRVYFSTAAGTAGSVFVEQSKYSKDNVAAAINAQASVIADVDNLTG